VGLVVPLVCLARLVWVVRSVRLALLVAVKVVPVGVMLSALLPLVVPVVVQGLAVVMLVMGLFHCLRFRAKMGETIFRLVQPVREPVAVAVVPVLLVLTLPLTLVGPVGQV
jgi:hypothetical protein